MEITATTTFDAPASAVWALMENFGAIENWWPKDGPITIDRVVCEGQGVGMVRHIYNHGMDKAVSERLDYLDDDNRTLILSIVGDRPGGITAYVAVGKLTEITNNQCRLDYRGYVTCAQGREAKVEKNILFTWERMFTGLRSGSGG